MAQAQQAALAAYLVLSRDLIDISVWFRRFAQSELTKKSGQDEPPPPASLPKVPDARA